MENKITEPILQSPIIPEPEAEMSAVRQTDVYAEEIQREVVREAQGDLGDRAELEIENELQGQIDAIRARVRRT